MKLILKYWMLIILIKQRILLNIKYNNIPINNKKTLHINLILSKNVYCNREKSVCVF